jgi:hypothetical protein
LAIGNSADILDLGWYGQYVEGGVTKFSGLFRDTSDTGKYFKVFQGVTIKPDPNIILKDDETNIANFQAFELEALGSLHVHVDAVIDGTLGATGDIDTGGVYTIEGTEVLSSNTLGSNITNASLTKNNGSLGITGNVNLESTSFEYFIDNVSVLSNDTLGVGVTFSSLERLGTLNLLNVTGLSTFDGVVKMNSDVGIDNLGVTFNTTIGGDLRVDNDTLFVDVSEDKVGINITPAYTLDVLGDINLTGTLFDNGVTIDLSGGGQWTTSGGDIYNNNLSGNVAIGTTTPSFRLDVSGDINTSTTLRIDGIDIETVFNIIQVENKKTYFNEFLTLDNSIDMTADYSGGVTEFTYTNSSSTETLFVSNLVISIQDDAPFNLNEYGGIGTTLPNGMNIFYTTNSGATKNYIVGTTYNINKNADYNNYTNDVVLTDLGTGDAIYTITLDFRNNGSFIILSQNEFFGIEVQDDMSSINGHRSQINGFTYANSEL